MSDEQTAHKRKREATDTQTVAQGSAEKEKEGAIVPAVPRSEGGAGEKKRQRYRKRPFPELSPGTAYERLQEFLTSTFGDMNNREDVLRRLDELLYLAEDVSKGCESLKKLMDAMDVGWIEMSGAGHRVFTPDHFAAFDKLPYIAQWLIEINSWDMVITHLFNQVSVDNSDLVHEAIPHVDAAEWRRTVTQILKKLYFLWKKHGEFPEAPATYETNWSLD